jgi:S-adenosylmethionine decarboxylase
VILHELRAALADITGDQSLLDLPADRPLFGEGAGLDSVTGIQLLATVHELYGVDIAAEDLSLGALKSLNTLERFLTGHGSLSPHRTLYLVDACAGPGGILTDLTALSHEVVAAVDEAGGHVVTTSHMVFPNSAVTLILILAESHLSLHTWPEERKVAIDLFSCGRLDGRAVIARLSGSLGLTKVRCEQIRRL